MFTIRIKMLRESLNMNKREFSEALNLPYTTYNNYETGTREPNSDVLISIAKKFDVSVDWLIGNDADKEKAPAKNAEAIHIDSTIRKYAQLDEHGKRIVAAVTDIEYERCTSIQNQAQLRVARGGRVTTEPLPDELILDDDTSDLDS